jgi:hypothetical protein
MAKSGSKRMGRPPANSTAVTVRLAPELLDWLDTERAKIDPQPSRPEMIRLLLKSASVNSEYFRSRYGETEG